MWVSLSYCHKDIQQAKDSLRWCHQLDGQLSHGILLTCDQSVDWSDASELLALAAKVFQRVELAVAESSETSWPDGPNSLFKTAAVWFQERKIGPFLWMEPDAVPLKKGWLDAIEAEYVAKGKPFMGTLMTAKEPNLPKYYLPGVAVYPHNAWTRMSLAWKDYTAFDVATAPVTVPFAADTPLIQHFWGQKDLPPTFVEATPEFPMNDFTVPDRNKMTLANIKPEAVLFHRNKDGTLLRFLGYKDASLSNITLDVVLPVCGNDAKLMLKNLMWMVALHGKKQATAFLLIDSSVVPPMPSKLLNAAGLVFNNVVVHNYSAGISGWPRGPNRAFQEACCVMCEKSERGWFWHEADAVAVVPDWLEQLSLEYTRAGKPFMGTIIGEADHLNGVAVYPSCVEQYAPVFGRFDLPWDVFLHPQIAPHRHRGNHLIQHHRSPPSFASMPDLREIENGVVMFHPDKSGRLMDWLAKRLFT